MTDGAKQPPHPFYRERRPCPKCGNNMCSSEYRNGKKHMFDLNIYERIVRRCGRCEHAWYELPLDWTQEKDDARLEAVRMRLVK